MPKRKTHPKGRPWPLQDAKTSFSEVVRRAHQQGPQHVTVHGKDSVVVVSAEEFSKLTVRERYPTLRSVLQACPDKDFSFEFEPISITVRPVDL
ncbi:MAG: type II toxin-antitoxin system Phd/YefM family antitoxin [Micropepsaceae bacterium]